MLLLNMINIAAASVLLNSRNNNNDMFWLMEEERRRETETNEKFKKDFEEYFQKQLKQIPYQITPDLFQIEPFLPKKLLI